MSLHLRTALAAGVGVTLAIPGVGQAAQKSVDMGTPLKSQKSFEKHGADVNGFFPSRVTIRVGDTVRFVPVGFHSLDIPPKGKKPLGLIAPTGAKVAGAVDAAGTPFWFNGLDMIGFDRALLKFAWGKRFTYAGATRVESGLPIVNRPKPVSVRFTKTGSFAYFCNVHPGMKGTVRVVGKGRRVPSARADARAVKAQVAAALNIAKSLVASVKPAANTVIAGVEGKAGVVHFGFVPRTLSVAAGTTVRFQMPTRSREVHTATFGPGDPVKDRGSYLGVLAASFEQPVFDPRAVYPSDQPPAVTGLTPASHGNGFWNSGALDGDAKSPLPEANSVTFAAAGTYELYCMVHPFMHGTIIVT